MPSIAIMKLIGIGVGILALIGLLLTINGWRVSSAERKAKLEVICQATRSAANNPKLACGQVAVQIKELGDSVANLKAGIEKQNAAVDALGAKSKADQAAAAEASKLAVKRAQGAEATAERLRASAGVPRKSEGPCDASKEAQNAWR